MTEANTNISEAMITLKLKAYQWDVISTTLNRLPFTEPTNALNHLREKFKDHPQEVNASDDIEIECSVKDSNVILACIKSLSFYDAFDIVTDILRQGSEQMQALMKEKTESAETK